MGKCTIIPHFYSFTFSKYLASVARIVHGVRRGISSIVDVEKEREFKWTRHVAPVCVTTNVYKIFMVETLISEMTRHPIFVSWMKKK
jgi:hypothetical protein